MSFVSRQRAARTGLIVCSVALVPLAARALFWLPAFQERRVARLSLAELDALTRREPENAVALLRYGQRLNQEGRFSDALVPLQTASGLDPDNGEAREAWAVAQLAGSYVTGAFGQLTQFVKTHPENPDGRRALGRFYVAQRAYQRAAEELDVAVKLAPDDAEAWSLLATARHGLGEREPACVAAERAVKLRPNAALDALVLATLYRESSREADALKLFERAATLAPNDLGIAREWADSLLKTGRPDDARRAETLAQSGVEKAPGDPAALGLLGRAKLALGKPDEARKALAEAAIRIPAGTPVSTLAKNEPTQFLDPAPALAAAQACTQLGRTEEARAWQRTYARRLAIQEEWDRLSDLVRNNPENRAGYRKLAALRARRGDAAEVAKNLARAESKAVDSPLTLVATSRLLTDEGYAEQAVAVARRAVLLGPRSPETHEALGDAQLAAGRGHEAAVAFSHAASWVPTRQPGYRKKLEAFYQARAASPTPAERLYAQSLRLPTAERLTALLRATQLDPKNTDVLRLLLKTYYAQSNYSEALTVAERLLAISPEDAIGLALRATVLLEMPGGAPNLELLHLDLLKAALEEELGPVLYAQGTLALRRKKPRDAVRFLHKAIALTPEQRTYQRLIEAYEALGDDSGANATREAQAKDRRKSSP